MRPLSKVMDATLAIIPADIPERAGLAFAIGKIRESISYTAPEAMGDRWRAFDRALNFHLAEIHADWTQTLADMIADKIPYQQFLPKE